jgi:hypothetical protein
MRLVLTIVAALAVMFASCNSNDPTTRATKLIAGWAESGMMLPDGEQREFFRVHRDQVMPALEAALAHKSESIRMRAAYVIESCEPASGTLASMLLRRVPVEKDRLVRIYIYNALCTHGPSSLEAADSLANRWNALDKKAITPDVEYEPSEASEAMYLAGALSVCARDQAARKQYAAFVLGWLEPPPANTPADKLDAYWEVRWSTLAALRSMPPTEGAVPLLEKMFREPNAKPWVEFQVKATLEVQRKKVP